VNVRTTLLNFSYQFQNPRATICCLSP
jgi:hypothetical protein